MSEDLCPICSSTLKEQRYPSQKDDPFLYKCPNCGEFWLRTLTMNTHGFDNSKQLIGAWIRRQHKLGNERPLVDKDDDGSSWFDSRHI